MYRKYVTINICDRMRKETVMGVRIIRGAIGSGKSGMCLDEIEKIHNENPSARCVMIVPDHYSYETERRAVERFGGIGLNNIEVLTLRRMALNTLTSAELNHLTAAGRQMLIYRAVKTASAELMDDKDMDMKLITSMKRAGFPDVAASLISEMKRYMVTPEILLEKAGEVEGNRTLKNKLTALASFYGKYTEYVKASGASDSEDDMLRLALHIERGCGYDENTYVWVDRFDWLLPQQIAVIEALLKRGVHMTVSVCNPVAETDAEREIYAETERTLFAVRRLADIYGYEGETATGKGLKHLKDKPDLYALLSHWTEDKVYKEIPRNIEIFQSRDTYSEIDRIACKITDLVREEGLRYRDIALMCGDENEYVHLVEAVFGEYEIPYFADRKIVLSDHPIAMQILSLFGIIEDDWSYESVFRYLRSGFIYTKSEKIIKGRKYTFYKPLNQDDVDELENFVLRCGIRGKKRWLGEEEWRSDGGLMGAAFKETEGESAGETVDTLRRIVAAPVAKFAEAVKGGKDARTIAEALFEYLGDINLYMGLKYEISAFKNEGKLNEAEQFTKIWNLILDVLDQTARAIPDEKLTAASFAEYMGVGLSKCEIRLIPSGIDQVYVGSAERVSTARVKAMFIAGARSGTFPTIVKTEGFLSNNDRNTLHTSLGVTIAPDTRKKSDEQYFKVYRALCAVTDRLYVSYAVQNEEGKTLSPSHMLLDIYRKFPKVRVTDNLTEAPERDTVYISSPRATMHKLLVHLSERNGGAKNPLWDYVHDWYSGKDEWRGALSLLGRADYYSRRGVMLDGDVAASLYEGKIRYSASRLDVFGRCPFRYFLQYGLGVKKRDEWEVSKADMGTYAHSVIREFCLTVEDGARTDSEKISAWKELTRERRTEIIHDIIDRTCENMLSSPLRDRERTAAIFRRMGKTIADVAALVQKSLSVGSYAEHGMEYEFNSLLSENAELGGKIDRLDLCADGGSMRIIDYKTGNTEFDVVNIINGVDMQMVLYALGAKEQLKKTEGIDAEVAGIYYTGVKNDFLTLGDKDNEDNIKETNENKMRLDGMTFASEDEDERKSELEKMDAHFYDEGKSSYTKAAMNKKKEYKNVQSSSAIDGLMDYVREKAADTDRRIRGGDISLAPYTSSGGYRSACTYCDYAPVCRFDEDRKKMREAKGNKNEIWEAMRTKGAARKGVKK